MRRRAMFRHFNPRPPWGGRLLCLLHYCATRFISIHALRGEGDATRTAHTNAARTFQSTPSVGRATVAMGKSNLTGRFQSTPSVGRATLPASLILRRNAYFNPRPPWGGRRTRDRQVGSKGFHFNPRPPWGGRRGSEARRPPHSLFQSTPSVGRATAKIYKYAMLCLYIVHIKLYIFATAVLFT